MITLRLALRMLWRDLRAGELHLLALALIVAVASLVSVGLLTDRVSRSLDREANQLLGGDLLLRADTPWPDSVRDAARRAGLETADTLTFSSMVSTDEAFQLVAVKAVSEAYPLRGQVRVAPARNAPDAVVSHMPAAGEIWPDERVMAALGLHVGDTLQLGDAHLRVGGVLTFESDRGANFFSMLPRVMVNVVDLPATGLIQTGSRVIYRLHLAGEQARVAAFRQQIEPTLTRGQKIESIDNARPEVHIALTRAERFLRLAATLAVVLAAVAIGLSARRFMLRHLDGCAVLRCLGARQGQLVRMHLVEFAIFALVASAAGIAIAWALQGTLAASLAPLLGSRLPPPGAIPLAHGVVVALVLMLGFVLPHLIGLSRVPTLRVMRREMSAGRKLGAAAWASGLATLVLIVLWVAGDARLGGWVSLGFVLALAGFALLSAAGFRLAASGGRAAGGGWRHGFQALRRRLGAHVIQAMALGLGLMALLVLTLVRADLLAAWRDTVPADAPNRFVINLQPDQRADFERFFTDAGLPAPTMEPMIRGRLVAVDGQPVSPEHYEDSRARRLAEREFNLSYSARLPAGNTIVAGAWHGAAQTPAFSIERGVADTLGIHVGDKVTFDVAGQRVSAPVTSVRDLRWDSMRVNFFFVASPGLLHGYPASLITSFHLPDARSDFGLALSRAFPNVSIIDVGAVLAQVEGMIDRLITVVQLVFGFALAAGVVVLLAALQSTQDERAREFAVMRALGARRVQLHQTLLVEFLAMGGIAGALAGVGASLVGWLLASKVFEMDYVPALAPVLVGALVGGAGVVLAGWLGARRLLRQPPLALLRDAV
ncbi:FtsX-like permease family protein [Nitrogeniibacter mangrovi]|uniref:FtsX-like permease family protein n=1 Tax=Nitrogeniibacter mangrovi TaxID=2016596 RepID=A0A6C1B4F5_9RHOO|nr:FtsX-like permease family protein [Nitrogeniibacter mangrovi]QID17745.1 FtsX-like permease family protein [Nitrogeniibacter mangrovi]